MKISNKYILRIVFNFILLATVSNVYLSFFVLRSPLNL